MGKKRGRPIPLPQGEAERPLCPTAARKSGAAPLSRCCEERRNGLSAPPPRGEAERSLCPTAARRGGTVSPSHCCEEGRNGLSAPPLRGEAERPLCSTAARRGGAAPLSHRCEEKRGSRPFRLSVQGKGDGQYPHTPWTQGKERRSAQGEKGRMAAPHPHSERHAERQPGHRRCRGKGLDGR